MSNALFDAEQIVMATDKWFAMRAETIEAIREQEIKTLMNKKRWFRKPYTREQAIKKLEDDVWSTYNFAKSMYYSDYLEVRKLSSLATTAVMCRTPLVHLSHEHANIIKDQMERQ